MFSRYRRVTFSCANLIFPTFVKVLPKLYAVWYKACYLKYVKCSPLVNFYDHVYINGLWKINLCKHSHWKFPEFYQSTWDLHVCFPYPATCQINNQKGQRETIPDLNFVLLKKIITHENYKFLSDQSVHSAMRTMACLMLAWFKAF